MTATSVSSSPPTTEPLRTRPSAKVTITLLAPSITWCVVRTWPCASRRTPEPNPRRGHGRPSGGPYAAPAVLTLTVLTPTRSTALTYAFCKSAIMATSRPPRGLLSEFPRGRSQSRPATKNMSVGRGGGCCRQANTQAPSGPKRLKRFLVFIEQPRFDDPVVLDPQEEEIRLLEDAIPPLPDCGGQCRGMHVAREDVDELRPKRPAAQLGELLEISKNRLVSAVISRDFGRAGHVPHRVLRDELLQGLRVARIEGRVQSLDEGRVRVLEHPHSLTS